MIRRFLKWHSRHRFEAIASLSIVVILVEVLLPATKFSHGGGRNLVGYILFGIGVGSVPIILADAALSTLGTIADRRARQRHAAGRCPACGYDLRASKGRCPECGRAIEQEQ